MCLGLLREVNRYIHRAVFCDHIAQLTGHPANYNDFVCSTVCLSPKPKQSKQKGSASI